MTSLAAGVQGQVTLLDQRTTAAISTRGATISRIIGTMQLRATTTNNNIMWSAGIVLVRGDAAAAAVVPDPWVDGAPWLWETASWLRTGDVQSPGFAGSERLMIDIKAQRKLPGDDDSLLLIITNNAASGGSLEFQTALKFLIKLP